MKYFGTDGIRSRAGEFPLTEDFIQILAFSVSKILSDSADLKGKKIIIGNDTRESCEWIFKALSFGFNSVGLEVDYAGVVSTPLLSLLTKANGYAFGVMISASHNQFQDNGIKFFSSCGEKLDDEIELKIETKIDDILATNNFIFGKSNDNFAINDIKYYAYEFYKNFVIDNLFLNSLSFLECMKIALDPSNGSLSFIAPKIFYSLGCKTFVVQNTNIPDGKNINLNCGSTHIDALLSFVKSNNVDIGFAFDGDGDRVIAVRSDGKVLDGDFLMAILAKYYKDSGELCNNSIALTVMSNLGLKIFLKNEGINFFETKVGDRYIYESLLKNNLILGGEQSGHIILKKYINTGDGLLVAVLISKILKEIGSKKFFNLTNSIKILPQVLVNVKLNKRVDYLKVNEVKDLYDKIESKLGENGRILVRYSGTEPLLRIMIEGENYLEISNMANDFKNIILKNFCF